MRGGVFTIIGDTCSNQTLAVGASCLVTVQFIPAAETSYASTVSFPTTSPLVTTPVVNVIGSGVAAVTPAYTISATGLDFGNQTINTSATRTITLDNTAGTGPVTLGPVAIVGSGFTITGDTCSNGTFAVGQTCAVTVQFNPTLVNDFTGSVTFPVTDPVVTDEIVSLLGSGVTGGGGGGGAGNARPIPTLDQWGLILLTSLLGLSGLYLRRRQR